MMNLLLLLALVVSAVGVWLSRVKRVLGQILMVMGGLGLITVMAVQVCQYLPPKQAETSSRCELAAGSCLANCVLGELAGQSGTVILLLPPRSLMPENKEQSYQLGFTSPFRHARRIHLKAVRLEAERGKAGYSLAAFRQALEQTPDALAFVSSAGVPPGFDALFSGGEPRIGPFYVFDAQGTTNWLGPLKDGHVRAVVVPRPGAAPRAGEAVAGTLGEIFERFYLLATLNTADQTVAQLGHR
jgi:hypothetical protein